MARDDDDDDGGKRRSQRVRPHLQPVAAHPLTLGRRPQPNARGGKVTQRPWGPTTGAKLSSIPLHTHIRTHYSHSHAACPLDLTIKTQEQILRLVTAAQKQMTPNT